MKIINSGELKVVAHGFLSHPTAHILTCPLPWACTKASGWPAGERQVQREHSVDATVWRIGAHVQALGVTKDPRCQLCVVYRESAVRIWKERNTEICPVSMHTRVLTLSLTHTDTIRTNKWSKTKKRSKLMKIKWKTVITPNHAKKKKKKVPNKLVCNTLLQTDVQIRTKGNKEEKYTMLAWELSGIWEKKKKDNFPFSLEQK